MNEKEFLKGRLPKGQTLAVRAPAKVNLHLEILKQRHDGYHEIETVLQAVSLFDQVRVTLVEEYPGGVPVINLSVSAAGFAAPADQTNLAWRAARHFCKEMGVSGRLDLELAKDIPPAAGLGGGSSDAAAVLVACNALFGTGLEPRQLETLAAPLGADVPFFIRGGTALGRGIGTRLTPLPTVRSGQFLIVKPDLELSTQEVYRTFKMGLTVNCAKANIHVLKPMLARFPQKTWPGFNRLEEVVLPSFPALQRLVLQLRDLAPVAMLSGSGASVVGVFEDGHDLTSIIEEYQAAGLYVRNVGPHATGVQIRED